VIKKDHHMWFLQQSLFIPFDDLIVWLQSLGAFKGFVDIVPYSAITLLMSVTDTSV
jgi:hypothetical protein